MYLFYLADIFDIFANEASAGEYKITYQQIIDCKSIIYKGFIHLPQILRMKIEKLMEQYVDCFQL